jgi:transposase
MAAERKQYTAEFKREAVRLMTEGGVSGAQVSRDLSVCRSLLGKWKRQLAAEQQTGTRAFPGHGQPADEELVRLRRENEILRQEREILKKAVSIFAPQLR